MLQAAVVLVSLLRQFGCTACLVRFVSCLDMLHASNLQRFRCDLAKTRQMRRASRYRY